jgi:primosomal protein N' (replication factor Y)
MRLERAAARLAAALGEALPDGCELLGPAPMFRVRRKHRRRMLVKSDERGEAVAAVREAVDTLSGERSIVRGVAVAVDVDPQ